MCSPSKDHQFDTKHDYFWTTFFPAQNRPNRNFAITPKKLKTAIKSVVILKKTQGILIDGVKRTNSDRQKQLIVKQPNNVYLICVMFRKLNNQNLFV